MKTESIVPNTETLESAAKKYGKAFDKPDEPMEDFKNGANWQKKQLKEMVDELEKMKASFYMDICRAYNAGKQNMINVHVSKGSPDEGKMFLSSHDYFTTEFPEFKTNVP